MITRAAVRADGGGFAAPVAISDASPDYFHPVPSMDAGGDASVVWVREVGAHSIVQTAGYDADPPRLGGVSIPSTARVGDPVSFSASGLDVWPLSPPSFSFGDGGQAAGTTVAHAYAAPGSFSVKVTATDAGGRPTASTGTVLVKARNFFTFGKLSLNRKKGTATQDVIVPEPGSLAITGKGIKKATIRIAKGGTVKVPLKAAGRGLKRLDKRDS